MVTTRQRRPPEVAALVALLLAAAGILAIAVVFPMSAQAPIGLGYAMIAVALAMAGATFALGRRLPRRVLLGEAVVAVLLNSVIVAAAQTREGAIGDALAYVWLTLYVAVFFPATAVPFAALVAVAYGAGLLAGGLPAMVAPWALVAVSVIVAAVVASRLVRVVDERLRTDALTGVLNRGGLAAAAAGALERARRRTEALSVAVIDLDAFKAVNEREGHAGGDRLLASAADAWREELRGEDVLARTGGDEFVLLMPGTSGEQAEAVLERLRRAHPVAWSAGVSVWRPGEPIEACIARADARLYEAKAERA
jgi:diguanylate cyclase (GGDEF)-like protein